MIGMGLICMFGYKKDINEVELVNKTVENFENWKLMNPELIVPVLGIMTGIIVPVSVLFGCILREDKNKTILEISKNIDDLKR